MASDALGIRGGVRAVAVGPVLHRGRVSADRVVTRRVWGEFRGRERWLHVVEFSHHNAFVNQGLQNALDRMFGLGGSAISHIGVSGDSTAVTAATTTLGSPNSIKAISPAETRTNQTVTGGADFDENDVTFEAHKIGWLTGSAATAVQNIIGGTGGVDPYDREFNFDFTQAEEFDLTLQLKTSLVAV